MQYNDEYSYFFHIRVLMLWKVAMGHFRFQNQIYDNEGGGGGNSKLNSSATMEVVVI